MRTCLLGICLLAKSPLAIEIITGEKYTGLKEATNPGAMAVAVEIEGLLSLEASSLAIGIKVVNIGLKGA